MTFALRVGCVDTTDYHQVHRLAIVMKVVFFLDELSSFFDPCSISQCDEGGIFQKD